MVRKEISVPEDVYDRLQAERCPGEGVSDVLTRLLVDRDLATFWGIWDDETVVATSDAIAESRARSRRRIEDLYD